MRSTNGCGIVLATAASAIFWIALLGAIQPSKSAEPPPCAEGVCEMSGPGGDVENWKLHVQLNDLRGARFVVPPGATCASACAIATGLGLYVGADFDIASSAIFIPHNVEAIWAEARMPSEFRELMLNGKSFHWKGN